MYTPLFNRHSLRVWKQMTTTPFTMNGLMKTGLLALALLMTACQPNDHDVTVSTATGEFIDYGFIPAGVDGSPKATEFQSAFYDNNHVYVATTDGIWACNLQTKAWSRVGLAGKTITALYQHPTMPTHWFAGVKTDFSATTKTVYISTDGGANWQASRQPVFNELDQYYENYACFAVRPGHPEHIYANVGGQTIAVSTDGGQSWTRQNNDPDSGFGYPCVLTFLPNQPDVIYQGAEAPLDDAWLGRYDIDPHDPVRLSNFRKVADQSTYGNRRPTQLQTNSSTGTTIYVGQEGALSKVSGTDVTFIYKSDEHATSEPYSYIYAIWVDPTNPRHLLFGGNQNGGDSMNLYETYDEGANLRRFTDKLGFQVPNVRAILTTSTYPAVLINDDVGDKIKLYLYKPAR